MEDLLYHNDEKLNKSNKFVRFFVCVYFFLCFFEPYLNGAIGTIGKYYIFLLMLMLVFYYKSFEFKIYHVAFALWFAYKLISVFWADGYHVFNIHFLSHVGMTGLFLVMTAVKIDAKTIKGIMYTMLFSSFSIGVLSLFFSRPYLGKLQDRLVLQLFGQEVDPNNQAAFLLFGITIALYFLIYLKKHVVLDLLVIAINTYSIFLTGSRGGFVSLILIIILMVLLPAKKFRVISFLAKAVILTFALVVLYIIAVNFLPSDILERIFETETYEDGSNRIAIWSNAVNLLNQGVNWVFGAGWGQIYYVNYSATHNTYLAMLCDVGILGSLLYFVPIICVAVYLFRKRQLLPLFILLSGLLPCFFLDAINKRYFWNPIIFAFVYYNAYRREID